MSGGQTGVDRAALDVARDLGIPCGGWCPRGRRAEDGPLDDGYPLRETPSHEYAQRTQWNVRDSDGTLVLTFGAPRGGTALTIRLARRLRRPCLVVDLDGAKALDDVQTWLRSHAVRTLNVAGPRETRGGDVYRRARGFLETVLVAAASS